jgi:hypothetical protein
MGYFCNKKIAQCKQSPFGRKFAQSGHTVREGGKLPPTIETRNKVNKLSELVGSPANGSFFFQGAGFFRRGCFFRIQIFL